MRRARASAAFAALAAVLRYGAAAGASESGAAGASSPSAASAADFAFYFVNATATSTNAGQSPREFEANRALQAGSGYWCSEGSHAAEAIVSWSGELNTPTVLKGLQIEWAYSPRELQVFTSRGGAGNEQQALAWRRTPSDKAAFKEDIFFDQPVLAAAVRLAMRGAAHDYFGIARIAPLAAGKPLLQLVSGITHGDPPGDLCLQVDNGRINFDRAKVVLDSCQYGVAAADGRELWRQNERGQLQAALSDPPKCLSLEGATTADGGSVILEDCREVLNDGDNRSEWEVQMNGQVVWRGRGGSAQFALSQGGASAGAAAGAAGAAVGGPGFANLAKSAKVSASSVASDAHAAARAVDGNPKTYWASGAFDSAGEHVVAFDLDLGAPRAIHRVRINWEYPPLAYAVSLSPDAASFAEVAASFANPANTTTDEVDADAPARFVRVTMRRPHPEYGQVAAPGGAGGARFVYGMRDVAVLSRRLRTIVEEVRAAANSRDARDKWFLVPVRTFDSSASKKLWALETEVKTRVSAVQEATAAAGDVVESAAGCAEEVENYAARVSRAGLRAEELRREARAAGATGGAAGVDPGVSRALPAPSCGRARGRAETRDLVGEGGFFWLLPRCAPRPVRAWCNGGGEPMIHVVMPPAAATAAAGAAPAATAAAGSAAFGANGGAAAGGVGGGAAGGEAGGFAANAAAGSAAAAFPALSSISDLELLCASVGLEPLSIRSRDTLIAARRALAKSGFSLEGDLIAPLSADFGCFDTSCSGKFRNFGTGEDVTAVLLAGSSPDLAQAMAGAAVAALGGAGEAVQFLPWTGNNVGAVLCSTNADDNDTLEQPAMIECEDVAMDNPLFNVEPDTNLLVSCPSWCGSGGAAGSAGAAGTGGSPAVYGGDFVYHEASSVCLAGLHAGLPPIFNVALEDGREAYGGSLANGVQSKPLVNDDRRRSVRLGPVPRACPVERLARAQDLRVGDEALKRAVAPPERRPAGAAPGPPPSFLQLLAPAAATAAASPAPSLEQMQLLNTVLSETYNAISELHGMDPNLIKLIQQATVSAVSLGRARIKPIETQRAALLPAAAELLTRTEAVADALLAATAEGYAALDGRAKALESARRRRVLTAAPANWVYDPAKNRPSPPEAALGSDFTVAQSAVRLSGEPLWRATAAGLRQSGSLFREAGAVGVGAFALVANRRWFDFVLTASFVVAEGDTAVAGVAFRARDPENAYILELDRAAGERRLVRMYRGRATVLATRADGGYLPGLEYGLHVETSRGRIRVCLRETAGGDLAELFDVQDETILSGTVAAFAADTSARASVTFTSMSVEAKLCAPAGTCGVRARPPADFCSLFAETYARRLSAVYERLGAPGADFRYGKNAKLFGRPTVLAVRGSSPEGGDARKMTGEARQGFVDEETAAAAPAGETLSLLLLARADCANGQAGFAWRAVRGRPPPLFLVFRFLDESHYFVAAANGEPELRFVTGGGKALRFAPAARGGAAPGAAEGAAPGAAEGASLGADVSNGAAAAAAASQWQSVEVSFVNTLVRVTRSTAEPQAKPAEPAEPAAAPSPQAAPSPAAAVYYFSLPQSVSAILRQRPRNAAFRVGLAVEPPGPDAAPWEVAVDGFRTHPVSFPPKAAERPRFFTPAFISASVLTE